VKAEGSATRIVRFKDTEDEQIQDIVARDGVCYVMTATETKPGLAYAAAIYLSRDLIRWTQVAAVNLPGLPTSFEVVNGTFYVGLGATNTADSETSYRLQGALMVGPESGSIWRLE
jgi:hypothetical protein